MVAHKLALQQLLILERRRKLTLFTSLTWQNTFKTLLTSWVLERVFTALCHR